MMMRPMNGWGDRKKTGPKEGVNLLDESTDSETTEHFSLPPLDLKPAKRKRQHTGCCSCKCVVVSVILILLIGALSALGYFTYNLAAEFRELKQKSQNVENGNAGNNNEFQSVHNSIQQFTNDIQELKSKADIFQKNFTAVWKKLNQLSTRQPTQSSSPEIDGMKQTVASLGSDLESLKTSTREEFDQIQKSLSNSEHVTPQADQSSLQAVVSDILGIQQNITLLRTGILTLTQEREMTAKQMNSSMLKLEDRLSILELRTVTEPTIDRSTIQDTIHEAVNDALTSSSDESQKIADLEILFNNMTLELNGLKLTYKLLNSSLQTSQQQITYLDQRVGEQDTRLVKIEKNNLQKPSQSPSSGTGMPSPQSSSTSNSDKLEGPPSSELTEPPSETKPTPFPIEEGKDGATDQVPLPPSGGQFQPEPKDQPTGPAGQPTEQQPLGGPAGQPTQQQPLGGPAGQPTEQQPLGGDTSPQKEANNNEDNQPEYSDGQDDDFSDSQTGQQYSAYEDIKNFKGRSENPPPSYDYSNPDDKYANKDGDTGKYDYDTNQKDSPSNHGYNPGYQPDDHGSM